ncbi:MAG: bifunctional precorrin-2 dehydrogenase/sirohydrochlorin ferrochelatase [Chitinispirillaceae bacterium]|nr:bifunctional precorrin-2 dehydrogenase/sirohydrochlorin ferrochelatase [Chitinispirillaceae bacterium]
MALFFPVMLAIEGQECLVVGGGRVALRKVIALLRAGAAVTVVSLAFNAHFRRLDGRITMTQRPFEDRDLTENHALVIGATDDPSVNRRLSARATALRVPCNIVDCPERCSFIVPAVVRRGSATIAISTGGECPRLSRHLKARIAATVGPEYAALASYLADVRSRVKRAIGDPRARAAFWDALFETDPLTDLRQHGWSALRERIDRLIGHHVHRKDTP